MSLIPMSKLNILKTQKFTAPDLEICKPFQGYQKIYKENDGGKQKGRKLHHWQNSVQTVVYL